MASKSLAALPLEKEAWVQNVPSKFQRPSLPTTQTSVAEIASTATASGVFGSTLHVVPLNCRTWLGTSFPPPPTAKMSVLETAEMPVNAPWADGAWTTLQLVPLKFSMSWPRPVPVPVLPTAQTSVEEMAVTALSVAAPPAIVGVVWMLQDVPLKNSTSGAPEPLLPTAQTAFLDKALTPESVPPLTAGAATTDQLVPLKFSISGPVESLPTAQMSVGDTAETALRDAPVTAGLVTNWKPLERSWRDSSWSSPGVIVGWNRREVLRFIGLLSWLNERVQYWVGRATLSRGNRPRQLQSHTLR